MTKFDHKANLPKLFKDNRLTILPITREYIIGRFENYQKLEYRINNIKYKNFPSPLKPLTIIIFILKALL